MPAKDIYHEVVKQALQKDGWIITDDPLSIKYGTLQFYIDLGAENLMAAEKDGRKIAVEIKSFVQLSPVHEFHTALGQFISYRFVLKQIQLDRILYLAIPDEVYQSFFGLPFTRGIVQENQLKYLVYDIPKEVILRWQT